MVEGASCLNCRYCTADLTCNLGVGGRENPLTYSNVCRQHVPAELIGYGVYGKYVTAEYDTGVDEKIKECQTFYHAAAEADAMNRRWETEYS